MAGVTPAEALLLTAEHAKLANGKVITEVKETEGVERTASAEVARLTNKYGKFKVTKLFPGAIPQLPETFDEALKLGQTVEMPQSGLGSFVVKK